MSINQKGLFFFHLLTGLVAVALSFKIAYLESQPKMAFETTVILMAVCLLLSCYCSYCKIMRDNRSIEYRNPMRNSIIVSVLVAVGNTVVFCINNSSPYLVHTVLNLWFFVAIVVIMSMYYDAKYCPVSFQKR